MSLHEPTISILVPAYNTSVYLRDLCRSVQAQTFSDFEVLIFDDGSSDNLAEAFAPFARDVRFRLTGWKQNRGLNAAWRELLEMMRGKFWVSPGADDILFPGFLKQRLDRLQEHPRAAFIHGAPEFIDETGRKIPSPFPELRLPTQMPARRALEVLLQHNVINQPSALIRSEATRKVLPYFDFNWQYAPDWYLWLLHAACGAELLWDNQPLHQYRIHQRSLSFDPVKSATRRAEIRLVPLCALNVASQFSPMAAELWTRWRTTLYRLWLFRAARLKFEGLFNHEWPRLAATAFHGKNYRYWSLAWEVFRYGWGVPLTGLKELRTRKRQCFRVAGIAQINDPVFFEAFLNEERSF